MVRIDPSQWLTGVMARCEVLTDVLRVPSDDYSELSSEEKNKIRQSQVEKDEVIRILGHHQNFSLIMKWDKVLGWLPSKSFTTDQRLNDFQQPIYPRITADEFLAAWAGSIYVWGGITKAGIDCSGFTQRYYLEVLGRAIPKNSRDQRKAGKGRPVEAVEDHDLIFCHRLGHEGLHHVGLYWRGNVWHAHTDKGVISQPFTEFARLYKIEEVVSL